MDDIRLAWRAFVALLRLLIADKKLSNAIRTLATTASSAAVAHLERRIKVDDVEV